MDKFIEIEKIPTWALGYLMYGQGEACLDDEDLRVVRAWEKANGEPSLVDVVEGSESEFEPHPAFGLAGETVTGVFAVPA